VLGTVSVFLLVFASIRLWRQHRLAVRHGRELETITDSLRRSQEALRLSEERFRRAFEDGPVGVILASPNGRVLRANRALCQMLGYTEDELLGLGLMDLAHPADTEALLRQASHLFTGEIPRYQLEQRFVRADRQVIWTKISAGLLSSPDGKPLYSLAIVEDITERMKADEGLRLSEERFSRVFHASPVAIVIATLDDGRFIDVNETCLRLVGYEREELLEQQSLGLGLWVDPAERETLLRRLAQAGSVRSLDARLRTKGGEVRQVLIAAEVVVLRGVNCVLALLTDITEREQSEAALRKSEERFQLIARATNDTVWDWDLLTNRVWWNEGIRTVFGYSADAVLHDGHWWDQHIHPEDRDQIIAGMRRVIAGGEQFWSAEYRYRRADGCYADVFDRAYVMHDPAGKPVRMIGAMMDITERKRVEKELARARDEALESVRLKSEFLANISHEVRTPLNGIIGMTVLLQDSELSPEQHGFVETIKNSSEALLVIINDILDFSKMEAGKLQFETLDFDLPSTVENTIEMLADRAERKHIELVLLIHPDVPPRLRGDPARLRQVLTNLVVNAIKFTERGEVVVRVAVEQENDSHVTLGFTVKDTGVGIPPAALPYLFQAFSQADGSTTRKYGGTGLGLAISKQIVEMMGGQIGVESTLGEGSTFWFTIRLLKQEEARPTQPSPAVLAGLRVLISDSRESNRQLLAQHATGLGLRATAVATGQETLEALRAGIAEEQPYALAVIDLQMADTDGLSLARTIKADRILAKTRLLLLTWRTSRNDTAILRAAGIGAVLIKPIKQQQLQEKLASLMTAPSPHETRFWLGGRSGKDRPRLLKRAELARPIHALVAEDNPINQRVAVALLEKLGYQAEAVANGREVLQALEHVAYEIILMDCQLPELDGFATTREIRRREQASGDPSRHVHIIAMTAFALRGAREECLAAGMDDYISKPVRLESLTDALGKITARLIAEAGQKRASAPAVSALDAAALEHLKHMEQPGKPSPAAELMELFLRDTPGALKEMEMAATRYDSSTLETAAHRLRGCAATLGASTFARLCGEIEDKAHARLVQEATRLVVELGAEFGRVTPAIQAAKVKFQRTDAGGEAAA
jgi:PAS domain S-box-containing protein